ncbi:hypothetical protein NBH00_13520 [Paraconexibacter antarcticus]|uniref:DUF4267 domain-containing protein n=1 Tax=Paraconexibacter antarcticus TaxID=2949664 RepID=A0ABY5DM02_9ACTN|nr:hypothetical protein [Paraconexibacter antarcticus]UTI62380.1 hypothetical protein NBH00_13520 [Paraconexibacter antarcticus]
MSRSRALLVARLIAAGRVAFGVALVAKPEQTTRRWLGGSAATAGTQAAVRGLGIRDLLLGAITLHTLNHPQVGPRWVATCAVADSVDLFATVAARDELPSSGVAGTVALAGGTAAVSVAIAGVLRRTAPPLEA